MTRTLNVVVDATRECLAIEVDTSLSGRLVGRVLDAIARERGRYPSSLVLDYGPECTSKTLDQWANERGVTLVFIRPDRPIENFFVESFNGKLRDEYSICTSFSARPTRRGASRLGGSTSTTSGRTALSATSPRPASRARCCSGRQRRPPPHLAPRAELRDN